MSLMIGTSGGAKTVSRLVVGTAGGNKDVVAAWVGTAGGNKQFYASSFGVDVVKTADWEQVWPIEGDLYAWRAIYEATPDGGTAPYSYGWSSSDPSVVPVDETANPCTFVSLDFPAPGTATCGMLDVNGASGGDSAAF